MTAHDDAMLGEVGLDRSFRIPVPQPADEAKSSETSTNSDESKKANVVDQKTEWETKPEERRRRQFTNLKTPVEHQLKLLGAQLELAFELNRNVSMHSVQAQGATVELLQSLASPPSSLSTKWSSSTSKICLHSYGGSADTVARINRLHPARIYFSFSTTINARLNRLEDLIRAVPDDRLLVESDYNDVRGSEARIWEILGVVCEAKGWSEERARSVIADNWKRFTTKQ